MEKETKPPRIDWRGADLRGVNLSGMNLEGADLRHRLPGREFFAVSHAICRSSGRTNPGCEFSERQPIWRQDAGRRGGWGGFSRGGYAQVNFGGAYIQGAIMPPPALEVAWEGYRKFLEGSANAPEAANGKVKENGQGTVKAPGGQGVVKEGFRKFLEGAAKTPQAANGKVNDNSMER